MKKLFFTRLLIYTSAVVISGVHPAVAVGYDQVGIWTYFFAVPAYMLMAFFLKRPRFTFFVEASVPAAVLFFLIIFSAAVDRQVILMAVLSIYAYFSTRFVFSDTGRGPTFAVIEVFLLGGVYYNIINFSRSSEELASKSEDWTAFLLVFSTALFLLHAVVLYLAAFPDRAKEKKRRELAFMAGFLLLIGFPLVILLPKDFVNHKIELNELEDEPPPNPSDLGRGLTSKGGGGQGRSQRDTQNGKPLGERPEKFPSQLQGGGSGHQGDVPEKDSQRNDPNGGGGAPKNEGGGTPQNQQGNGSSQGDNQGQDGSSKQSGQDKGPKLEGVPADQWDNYSGSGGGSQGENQSESQQGEGKGDQSGQSGNSSSSGKGKGGKQKAVMIIVSPVNPVYAASDYIGDFDKEKGFMLSEDILINRLKDLRLLETWKNFEPMTDAARKDVEIFYLSTIKYRVVAYRPESVEPTVMNKRYHPFNLSYKSKSLISLSGPEEWENIVELSYGESKEYEKYLHVDLEDSDREVFKSYLKNTIGTQEGYFGRVKAILVSFKDFQYELGMDDEMNVSKIRKFLVETKTGDCSEFSHTVALLGRMAGIPTRVVQGYVASKDLQTPAHRGGVKVLRKSIPILKKYPASDIYLVTTSHRHAWVQFYMPGYGWVDIETTSYAKPPKPEMDPNAMDVVIPLIEEKDNPRANKFVIPWRFMGKLALILASGFMIGLYGFRYGREVYFFSRSKASSSAGLTALYSFVLMRLAANGYPLKQKWKTPKEYAASADQSINDFAELYTMLRFREMYGEGEREKAWSDIRNSAKTMLKTTRKKGFFRMVLRWFSLRGIYY
ncbi:MAG: transglutaminase domain-containing protein [Spirochaetia bacterium]|nr:transglutaminase domain-containing protein [Spirochaetia bacterium]